MKSNTYYIYELWNPSTSAVFYVGKGTKYNNSYYRLSNHIKDSKYALQGKIPMNHKFRTILNILESGTYPDIKIVLESTDINIIRDKEIELIKFYGRRDIGTGILTNHTDGGEGMLGYRHTQEHINRLKIDNKGGQATAKPIYAICPTTGEVTLFPSANNAAKILNGSNGNISDAAKRNKHRTACGYFWRFKEEYDNSENFTTINYFNKLKLNGAKRVHQCDINDKIIKTWNSASEICRHYNKSVSTLARHISSGNVWNGFIWRYVN